MVARRTVEGSFVLRIFILIYFATAFPSVASANALLPSRTTFSSLFRIRPPRFFLSFTSSFRRIRCLNAFYVDPSHLLAIFWRSRQIGFGYNFSCLLAILDSLFSEISRHSHRALIFVRSFRINLESDLIRVYHYSFMRKCRTYFQF